MALLLPKQELLTTQVLRFGKDKNMIASVTYGRWDALFTKCAHCFHPLGLKTFLGYFTLLQMGLMKIYKVDIPKISRIS